MAVKEIDVKLFSRMFLAGAIYLDRNKEEINELNVFPVPDGDTGTNMTMTIMSAAREVRDLGEDTDMKSLCKAMSGGSLRGARGNSGVILSQLLRGFTKAVRDEQVITVPLFGAACTKAVETAYKAVMKPTEGTILTVARGMGEKAAELIEDGADDFETILPAVFEHGNAVLAQTPELLPVLKQAGVVDSGGAGLMKVIQGAIDLFSGKDIDLTISDDPIAKVDDSRPGRKEEVQKNIYHAEMKVVLKSSVNGKIESDVKGYLSSIGELKTFKSDGKEVFIDINTDDPGLVLQKALKFGIMQDVKITCRLEPAQAASAETENASPAPKAAPEPKGEPSEFGFVAVSAGSGLAEIFRSLGVDYVIEGGQTMNPSTADILDAVEKVNAKTVFVLPNNKNIIMAANQARDLTTDKTVLVIPTKTIPQGITAAINFSAGASADENEQAMMEAIGLVKTGEITYAVRDTSIDDHEIRKGDYMGIGDKKILSVGTDMDQVVVEMIGEMVDDSSELISLYYGADVTEEDANALKDKIAEKFSSLDVDIQNGGQPVYYYIVSVE
ncbi:MAG: DAK2 domain-containing protein [Lachnospiraceae bacterium]|nr:DAK2 domain-containing protein [Lachnospiraceae bacterium]